MSFSLPSPSQLVSSTDIVATFQNLYNLGFAILVALAFLSFVYGAFQYLLSGASFFNQQEGKNRMRNSLIALIIVLIIPPILNLINPQIFQDVKMQIPKLTVRLPTVYDPNKPGSFPGAGTTYNDSEVPEFDPRTTKYGCNIPESGSCSWKKILQIGLGTGRLDKNDPTNPDFAKKLALICLYESGGYPGAGSSVDRCKNDAGEEKKGPAFSIGLFQINMAVRNFSYTKNGVTHYCKANEIFSGTNYDCKVINIELYQKCVSVLRDPFFNTYKAIEIAQGDLNNWSVWKKGVYKCFQ